MSKILIPLLIIFLNASIIIFPGEALRAAREGLGLWLDNALPALLPFAIGINLLTALGFTRFLGVLLEPVMQPLFRVPGVGGFAVITGLMSGSPLGAKITAGMRADGLLTAGEARRLAGFTNNCGPLFIIGAVGAGLLGDPSAGYFLFAIHLTSALTVGFFFRFYGKNEGNNEPISKGTKTGLLTRATAEMQEARRSNEGMGFGGILGTGVADAMETMVLIGGYIVLFAVIIGIIDALGIFGAAEAFFNLSCEISEIFNGAAAGLFEITAGVRDIAAGSGRLALAAAAGVISWGGLCIHAQSLGFIAKTDIGAFPYLLGKSLHAILAGLFAFFLYPAYTSLSDRAKPAALFAPPQQTGAIAPAFNTFLSSAGLFIVSMAALTVFALILYFLMRMARSAKKRA